MKKEAKKAEKFKSGFVSIIGKPNTGKSTLLNSILQQKISIVSKKAQTTRRKITGIYNQHNAQIVFLDTPGIIKPSYLLHEKMNASILAGINESDIILIVFDIKNYIEFFSEENKNIIDEIKNSKVPVICVINKIDLLENKNEVLKIIEYLNNKNIFKELIPVSALNDENIDDLKKVIISKLPENPPYYDSDSLSDAPVKFFISELIREKIFEYYSEEIPYSAEVQVDEYKERKNAKDYAEVSIIVERESQKGIIIGKNGDTLKKIGEKSRKEIENFINKGIYLKILVKVRENWRKDEKQLMKFGY
jgi:GTPase